MEIVSFLLWFQSPFPKDPISATHEAEVAEEDSRATLPTNDFTKDENLVLIVREKSSKINFSKADMVIVDQKDSCPIIFSAVENVGN